eukprot:422471_1
MLHRHKDKQTQIINNDNSDKPFDMSLTESKKQKITQSFSDGVNNISALCTTLHHTSILNVPYNLLNAYKYVLSFGLELNIYSWTNLDHIKKQTNIKPNKESIANSINDCNNYFIINDFEQTVPKIVQHWFDKNYSHESIKYISLINIIDIVLIYFNPTTHLKWSEIWNSDKGYRDRGYNIVSFEFSDNMECVKKIWNSKNYIHKYILCDANPVYNGTHCWRVHVTNPGILFDKDEWVCFGISEQKEYGCFLGDSQQKMYGLSVFGEYYPSDCTLQKEIKNNKKKQKEQWDFKWYFNEMRQYKVDVDILLNIDECTLKIMTVGLDDDRKEAEIWNLPIGQGWVPHFNIRAQNIELKVTKIPIQWYGKKVSWLKR